MTHIRLNDALAPNLIWFPTQQKLLNQEPLVINRLYLVGILTQHDHIRYLAHPKKAALPLVEHRPVTIAAKRPQRLAP